jgi:hypothetical protein
MSYILLYDFTVQNSKNEKAYLVLQVSFVYDDDDDDDMNI